MYRREKISAVQAQHLAATFLTIARDAMQDTSKAIASVRTVSEYSESMIRRWNDFQFPVHEACVHETIALQARNQPDVLAVDGWDGRLSYRELVNHSDRLAGHLSSLDVRCGTRVPILFEKSKWAIVAMIGILKAGGAFVPLEVTAPRSRLETIIQKVRAPLVVTSGVQSGKVEDLVGQVVLLDDQSPLRVSPPVVQCGRPLTPSDTAYIMFTSGSTGTPKGVIISHRAFLSGTLGGYMKCRGVTQGTRVLQYASYTFDASMIETIGALSVGATTCIISEEKRLNDLTDAIGESRAEFGFLTTTVASLVDASRLPSLKALMLGGEKLNTEQMQKFTEQTHLIEIYGPTEATCFVTVRDNVGRGDDPANIGRSNWAKIWLIDSSEPESPQLASVGTIGEIHIEGSCLADGYLDESATRVAFLRCTIAGESRRVYRTGDLARYNSDGSVNIIGRRDDQVKIAGQRVELSEIEAHVQALSASGATRVAVEAIKGDDTKRSFKLCAFIEPRPTSSKLQVQEVINSVVNGISSRLPRHMIPSYVFPIEPMPTSIAGKIDRRRLREVGKQQIKTLSEMGGTKTHHAASSGTEQALCDAVAEVMEIDKSGIGMNDDFLTLGADSLNAMQLVSVLRDRSITLTVPDIYQYSRLSEMAQTLRIEDSAQPSPPSYALLECGQLPRTKEEAAEVCGVTVNAIEDIYPCTPLQEGFMALGAKGGNAYVAQDVTRLPKDIDLSRYRTAWERLVEQESILRTRIAQTEESGMVQVVLDEKPQWQQTTTVEEANKLDKKRSMISGSRLNHHWLVSDITSKSIVHIWTRHHVLYDGWSLKLIKEKLRKLYNGITVRPPNPPFKIFIQYLQQANQEAARTFWKSYLDGSSHASFPPSAVSVPNSARYLTSQLSNTKAAGFTASVRIQAAWALTLARYAETDDIVYGTTLTGRTAPIPGIDGIIGPTITTVPVRLRLSKFYGADRDPAACQTLRDVLDSVRKSNVDSLPHQHFGLRNIRLVSEEAAQSCDFTSLLVVQPAQNTSSSDNPFNGSNDSENLAGLHTYSFLLNAELNASSDQVRLVASFDENVISPQDVERMLAQVGGLIKSMESGLDALLEHLELTTDDEESTIKRWNDISRLPVQTCIHELFEQRVRIQPQEMAVCFGSDFRLTYQELDRLSSRLAQTLVGLGTRVEDIVPLAFEKSPWTVVGILGVLKAGAAFVLLDVTQPLARLRFISSKVGAKLIVSSPDARQRLSLLFDNLNCVVLGEDAPEKLSQNQTKPDVHVTPQNAAYVMFTSGSTGMPKGCVLTHGSNSTASIYQGTAIGMNPKSRSMQFASYSFTASIVEIIATLIHGGCVCVLSDDERLNDVVGAIDRLQINWAFMTPSLLNLLTPSACPSLKNINTGGESIRMAQIETWAPHVSLSQGWGNAECCGVVSTSAPMVRGLSTVRDVGAAVTALCWIVEPYNHNRLAPLGAVGELVVEGCVLGRGYLDEPDKTAATFINAPAWRARFGSVPESHRFYKSGDLMRYAPSHDGALEFHGRKDTQIKFHGQRIELGEIEYHVKKALPTDIDVLVELVIPKDRTKEDSTIAAFLILGDKYDGPDNPQALSHTTRQYAAESVAALKAHVPNYLPGYMTPTVFIPLRKAPMTVSGKFYRKGLRDIAAAYSLHQLQTLLHESDVKSNIKSGSAKPECERSVREALSEVLQVKGANNDHSDNFFDMGGDSLSAMALVAALRRKGWQVSVSNIFRAPTLDGITAACTPRKDSVGHAPETIHKSGHGNSISARMQASEACGIHERDIEDIFRCTPVQEDVLLASAIDKQSYTGQVIVDLPSGCDLDRFIQATEEIFRDSSILRSRVAATNEGLMLVVTNEMPKWTFAADLEVFLAADKRIAIGANEFLHRVALIQDPSSSPQRFVWTVHHAVFDGWSMELFFRRVYELYHGLPSLRGPQFIRYTNLLQNKDQVGMRDFWKSHLAGFQGVQFPILPTRDYKSHANSALSKILYMPPKKTSNVTVATIVRTAWALVLAAYTGSRDCVFGTIEHGRNEPLPGIGNMLGPTAQVVPLRVIVDPRQAVKSLLELVHGQLVEMQPHQSIGIRALMQLSNDARAACDFHNALSIMMAPDSDDSDDQQSFFPWHFASQDLADFHKYALTVKARLLSKGNIHVEIIYDSKCVNQRQADNLATQIEHVTRQLYTANDDAVVGDIDVHVIKSLSTLSAWSTITRDQVSQEALECGKQIPFKPTVKQDQNATARAVSAAWKGILKVDEADIGEEANFFALGGDSLKAMELVAALRSQNIGLTVREIYQNPDIKRMAYACDPMSAPGREVNETHRSSDGLFGSENEQMRQHVRDCVSCEIGISWSAIQRILPCTYLQREMLRTRTQPNAGLTYYIKVDFDDPVDATRLEAALNALVERHAILRTVFVTYLHDIVQAVVAPGQLRLVSHQQVVSLDMREQRTKRAILEDKRYQQQNVTHFQPRFVMFGRKNSVSRLAILGLSHAQFDGFSLPFIFRDLSALYAGHTLEVVPQFSDYVDARQQVSDPERKAFWQDHLRGARVTNILPPDQAHPREHHHLAESLETCDVSMSTWRSLRAPSSDVLAAAWAFTLAQLHGTSDVVFGQTLLNRTLALKGGSVERILGPCVNILPVRVQFGAPRSSRLTPRALLDQVAQQRVTMQPFESTDLDLIADWCPTLFPRPHRPRLGGIIVWQDFAALHATHDDATIDSQRLSTTGVRRGDGRGGEHHTANALVLDPFAASTRFAFNDVDCAITWDEPHWDPADVSVIGRPHAEGEAVRLEMHYALHRVPRELATRLMGSLVRNVVAMAGGLESLDCQDVVGSDVQKG